MPALSAKRRACYMIKFDGTRRCLSQRQMAQMLLPLVTLVSVRVAAFQQFLEGRRGSDLFIVCRIYSVDDYKYDSNIEPLSCGKRLDENVELSPALRARLQSLSFSVLALINARLQDKVVAAAEFVYLLAEGDQPHLADIANCRLRYAPGVGKSLTRPCTSPTGWTGPRRASSGRVRNCSFRSVDNYVRAKRENNQRYWSGGGQNWTANKRTNSISLQTNMHLNATMNPRQARTRGHSPSRSFDGLLVTAPWSPSGARQRARRLATARPDVRRSVGGSRERAVGGGETLCAQNQIVIRLPGAEPPLEGLSASTATTQKQSPTATLTNSPSAAKTRPSTASCAKPKLAEDYPIAKISISVGTQQHRHRLERAQEKCFASPPRRPICGLVQVLRLQQMFEAAKRTLATRTGVYYRTAAEDRTLGVEAGKSLGLQAKTLRGSRGRRRTVREGSFRSTSGVKCAVLLL